MDSVFPLDVLLDILALLPLSSVLALRLTCKSLHQITHLRALWAILFRIHVIDKHIPFPDTALDDSPSARVLESLTRRAITLRRTWTSPEPTTRRNITFMTPNEPPARIIFLQFLPGRSHRWLISVRMTAQPKSYLLQCWDVARTQPRCVAELRHADGPYGGVVLNSDPSSSSVLAMQSAQTETFSIDFDADDPECGFETEATIDGIRELHLLSGSTLITRRIDAGGALCVWDLSDLTQEKVQLLNPSIIQPDDRVQDIHLARDYAVVVRIQSIEIYSTTPRPNLVPHRGAPIAYPLAQFKFQWRTDTVVLCEQHAPLVAPCSSLSPNLLCPPRSPIPRPIHLVVRFSSIYPWPVNVLHHYLMQPSLTYNVRSATTEYNLPYNIHPRQIITIGSPVRLCGQSAVALGPHGTALWLDHHTEEWLGPGERGQRLAGRMIGVGPHGNPIVSESPPTSSSMVFGMGSEDDAWTRIAMEEEAGRIALGHIDGAITLLEY